MKPLYLIDASIYIFRAWFSVSDEVVDGQGRPSNAFMGFFDFTLRFLNEVRPRYLVFAFDESLEKSFRNEIYPAYKANREPAPEALRRQFAHCQRLVEALGISGVSSPRYEADDLIGALAKKARQNNQPTVIVSGDKDLAQLLGENDVWWDYAKRRRLDARGVFDWLGVMPNQIPDLLALAGDASDNVPGVPGIGHVTATRLIAHFGSAEAVLERADEVASLKGLRGAERVSGLVRKHAEKMRLSGKLTRICTAAPLPEDLCMAVGRPSLEACDRLSAELGMKPYRRALFLDYARMQSDGAPDRREFPRHGEPPSQAAAFP